MNHGEAAFLHFPTTRPTLELQEQPRVINPHRAFELELSVLGSYSGINSQEEIKCLENIIAVLIDVVPNADELKQRWNSHLAKKVEKLKVKSFYPSLQPVLSTVDPTISNPSSFTGDLLGNQNHIDNTRNGFHGISGSHSVASLSSSVTNVLPFRRGSNRSMTRQMAFNREAQGNLKRPPDRMDNLDHGRAAGKRAILKQTSQTFQPAHRGSEQYRPESSGFLHGHEHNPQGASSYMNEEVPIATNPSNVLSEMEYSSSLPASARMEDGRGPTAESSANATAYPWQSQEDLTYPDNFDEDLNEFFDFQGSS
jgi:hypothetical protein